MKTKGKTQNVETPISAEFQPGLPGIPEATIDTFRVNYKFVGPNYALRSASLIIPARGIQEARNIALETISHQHGKKWSSITSIVQLQEDPPF